MQHLRHLVRGDLEVGLVAQLHDREPVATLVAPEALVEPLTEVHFELLRTRRAHWSAGRFLGGGLLDERLLRRFVGHDAH